MVLRLYLSSACLAFAMTLQYGFSQTPIPGHVGRLVQGAGGTVPYIGDAFSVHVSGNYAYVAATVHNALEIVDVSNPAVPIHAGSVLNGAGGAVFDAPYGVFVLGNYAYVANSASGGSGSLEIVDISNPLAPVHKGKITDGMGGALLAGAASVYVSGNYAYVTGSNSFALEIVDVTDRAAPVHKSSVAIAGINPYSVFVSGNYAYIVGIGGSNAFQIIDVSDPATPVLTGTLSHGTGGALLNDARAVHVSGNYAYVASSGSHALEVVNISNPAAPVHHGSLTNGTGGALLNLPRSIFVSGNYAYVGSQGSLVLEIVDISNPAQPAHAGSMGSPNVTIPRSIYVSGNYAYVAGGNHFEILAIFTPPQPVVTPPTNVGSSAFTAHWNAVENATSGYAFDLSTDNFSTFVGSYNNSAQSGTAVSITGLSPGTSYQYRVRAINPNGASPSSGTVTVTTAPPAPVATAATSPGQTSFTANWNAVAGASNYSIDVATNASFANMVTGFNGLPVATTSVLVSGLAAGTTYYYRVRSSNATGDSQSSNDISQITVPPTPVPAAANPIGQTSFRANWAEATGASGYFVDVKDATTGATLTGYNNLAVAAIFLDVVNGISGGTDYQFVVRATNAAGTTGSSSTQQVLTRAETPTAGPADPNPGLTSFNAVWSSVKSATSYNINVATDQGFSAGSILSAYDNKVVGNVTTLTIDALPDKKYYYQVGASNASGPSPFSPAISVTTAHSVNNVTIAFPTGGTVTDYRIISIPQGTTATTTLSDDSFEKSWRIMHYMDDATGNLDVRAVSQFQTGSGYWVNSNINPAPTITLNGTIVPQAITMTLQPGWNQIGNPLDFDVAWTNIKGENIIVNGIGLVGNLFIYNSTGFQLQDGLRRYGGGFVNNTSTTAITLTIPANIAPFTGRMRSPDQAIESRDLSAEEWFVPLKLKVGETVNDLGGIGMHPAASNSIDRFDAIALPRFFNYAELSSNHPEFFQPRFMRDVVPTTAQQTWTLAATSNSEERHATISWENDSWAGSDIQLYLYDETAGVLVDMKRATRHSFKLGDHRSVQVYFSARGEMSPAMTLMGQPFPNPFTDRIAVPFLAKQGDAIQIQFFDVTGRPVRTLSIDGANGGYREVEWDATDSEGNSLSKGMYVYRFRSSTGSVRTGKIILR